MKKLKVNLKQVEVFEIAKILKINFPEKKIFIHRFNNNLTIRFSQKVDYLKIQEIKTFLKLKYPHFYLVFQNNL